MDTNEQTEINLNEDKYLAPKLNDFEIISKVGKYFIPLRPNTKVPMLKKWTESELSLEEILETYPFDINFGIRTGDGTNLAVFDIDPRNGGDKALQAIEKRFGKMYSPVTVATQGGGLHFYFACPPIHSASLKSFLKGVDWLSNYSMVVAPPSKIDNREYRFINKIVSTPLPFPPDFLIKILLNNDLLKGIIETGNRNLEIFKRARVIHMRDLSKDYF